MHCSLSSKSTQRRLVPSCTHPPEIVLQLVMFGKVLRAIVLAEQRVASRPSLNIATVLGEHDDMRKTALGGDTSAACQNRSI